MPYSSSDGKQFALRAMRQLPGIDTVLDIGAGSGTWARLARPEGVGEHWKAVEIHEPYLTRFKLHDLYDEVAVSDGITYLTTVPEEWDLVILGDVVEHYTREKGARLVELACKRASYVIISLPIIEWHQGESEGNEHEAHLHHWSDEEVREHLVGDRTLLACDVGDVIGVYIVKGDRT